MRRRAAVLSALLAGLAVAGCGGSKSSTSSTPVATTATSTQTTSATTTTVTRTVPGPPAGMPLCRAATLALSYLGQQGAAGHGLIAFALKNTGSSACHTGGFPGILWLDRSGHSLPTVPKHVTTDLAGSTPVTSLDVRPGDSVSFRLTVTHGAVPGLPCTTAYGLQVIPPNDTSTLHVAIPDGGAYECRDTTVSPLRPGTTANPS